jgi:ankyrin repeat protein
MMASANGHLAIVHALLGAGADPNYSGTWKRETAFDHAHECGHWQIYVALLASRHGHSEVASALEAAQPGSCPAVPRTRT